MMKHSFWLTEASEWREEADTNSWNTGYVGSNKMCTKGSVQYIPEREKLKERLPREVTGLQYME